MVNHPPPSQTFPTLVLEHISLQYWLPWIAFTLFVFVWLISLVGYAHLWSILRKPSDTPPAAIPPLSTPFVSIIRPVKGHDATLEMCLASVCVLDYPSQCYELVCCVASPDDSAIPTIRRLIEAFPNINVKLQIGEEDVGPNPKIRNMSRGYREARGDVLWVLDANVWVSPGILQSSVAMLEGHDGGPGYKLVHHLPLCVDITGTTLEARQSEERTSGWLDWRRYGGGRMEEAFFTSAHAKFYCAINYIAIAPCIVGKSNLFRKSHLEEVTTDESGKSSGINYFAEQICEDYLIAEKLWMTPLREETSGTRVWRKHGLSTDMVLQPIVDMSVGEYLARRTRWIRVRKYSVLAATLIEPFTESFLCSIVGAYAATNLPMLRNYIGNSTSAFCAVAFANVALWAVLDRLLFQGLCAYHTSTLQRVSTPKTLRESGKRGVLSWLTQWAGREFFTFGIWLWAMWPGEVIWRGGRYRVLWKDMRVEQIGRVSEQRKS